MTTTTTTPEPLRISWGPVLWILVFHVGAFFAVFPSLFSWQAVVLCVFLHWLTGGVGICMTYHRLLTHRSFAPRPKWLEYVLTAIGCAASEGGPVGWVADHRRHHAHSDDELDAHSPRRGFGWAHMFWWMTPDITADHTPEYYQRWAPDLVRDPALVWLENWHFIFPVALGVMTYVLGAAIGGTMMGLSFLVWGTFLRTVLVLHATWLVNSATHIWGYRTHKTRDDSTNLWWVAIVTYGEGWHNNHHAYQTSARHGLAWWEIDMTYMAIRFLNLIGLADSIKLAKVNPERLYAKPTLAEEPAKHVETSVETEPGAGPGLVVAAQ